MAKDNSIKSSYLEYLPDLLQNQPILNGFLLAFEKVLSGFPDQENNEQFVINSLPQKSKNEISGIEQIIDSISNFFDPNRTPEEFLPWLANWVALSLRDDWDEQAKRKFIHHISYLYRLRGTKAGLETMLELYVNPEWKPNQDIKNVTIDEEFNIPHYFQVEVYLKTRLNELEQQKRIILSIIDQSKPAHTFYALRLTFPTIRIVNKIKLEKEIQKSREEVWKTIENDFINGGKVENAIEKLEKLQIPLDKYGIWVGITTRLGVAKRPEKTPTQ